MRQTTANGVLSEATEQQLIFHWAEYSKQAFPELVMLYAIPNGGSRNKIEAHNLKLQGVKSGVPDMFLPIARGGYHGLYIELKRKKGGVVSEHQKKWIEMLNGQGYYAMIAHGSDEAIQAIMDYLKCKIVKK